jgi:chromosome segregation ATPase
MATINSASYIHGTDAPIAIAEPKLAQLRAGTNSIADLVNYLALNVLKLQPGDQFDIQLSGRTITPFGQSPITVTDPDVIVKIAQVIERIRTVAAQALPPAARDEETVAAADAPTGAATARPQPARRVGADAVLLEAEAAGLRANLERATADRDSAIAAQAPLNTRLDALQQQNTVLERNAATLQERTAQQAQELIRVQTTVQSQQARLQELERLNASANRELDQARETIRAKEAQIARTADDAAELPQLRRDLERFQADLAAKERTLAQAQRDAAGLTDQLATLRREQDAHVTGLRAEFAQERIRLETQRQELERDNTRLANEAGALRGTADTQHTEIAALQQNVDARQADIRGLHERMEALQHENGRLLERSEQLQATLERATAQGAVNQAAAAELTTLQNQYEQEKAAYERSLAHCQTELAELKKLIIIQ